jgi:hypothetical protein
VNDEVHGVEISILKGVNCLEKLRHNHFTSMATFADSIRILLTAFIECIPMERFTTRSTDFNLADILTLALNPQSNLDIETKVSFLTKIIPIFDSNYQESRNSFSLVTDIDKLIEGLARLISKESTIANSDSSASFPTKQLLSLSILQIVLQIIEICMFLTEKQDMHTIERMDLVLDVICPLLHCCCSSQDKKYISVSLNCVKLLNNLTESKIAVLVKTSRSIELLDVLLVIVSTGIEQAAMDSMEIINVMLKLSTRLYKWLLMWDQLDETIATKHFHTMERNTEQRCRTRFSMTS